MHRLFGQPVESIRFKGLRFSRSFVSAAWGVYAFIGQPQPRDGNPVDDVRFDDFLHVRGGHAAIPNRFRINDNRRAVLALVQTSGFIGSDRSLQTSRGQFLFEVQLQASESVRIATSARIFRRSQIGADKNMLLKLRHNFSGGSDDAGLFR